MRNTLIRWLHRWSHLSLALCLSVSLGSVFAPAAASPAAAGQTVSVTASASYIPAGYTQIETIHSNTLSFTIQAVEALVLTQDQSVTRLSNAEVNLSHLLTNSGNVSSSYSFNLINNGPGCSSDTLNLSALRLVQDSNNNGVIDASDPVITLGAPAALTLTAGASASLIVQSVTPAVSSGNACLTLTVTSALQAVTAVNHDSVTLGSVAALVLLESVSTPSLIVPGSSINFSTIVTNVGAQNAAPVLVNVNGTPTSLLLVRSLIPSGLQLVAGSLQGSMAGAIRLYRLPGDGATTYRTVGDASAIEVALGMPLGLAPNTPLTMTFSSLVTTAQSGSISATTQAYFNDGSAAATAQSNTVFINFTSSLIGVAKAASSSFLNVTGSGLADGTLTVHFLVRIKNYGGKSLYDVQVPDLLEGAGSTQFGTYTTATLPGANQYTIVAGSLALAPAVGLLPAGTVSLVNPNFTGAAAGAGAQNLLANGAVLPVGADITLGFDVRVNVTGRTVTLLNAVRAQAALTQGAAATIFDDSVNGLDPDPDADGNPGNNASSTPVFLLLPLLNLSKSASLPRRIGAGVFDIDYIIKISNTGGASAPNVRLIDNINCALQMDLPSGFISSWTLVGKPVIQGSNLLAAANFTGNVPCNRSSYTSSNPSLLPTEVALSLTDGSLALAQGQSEQVSFTVRMTEKASALGHRVQVSNKAWAASFQQNTLNPISLIAAAAGTVSSFLTDPQGTVYNAVTRQPIAGAIVTVTRQACSTGVTGPIVAAEILGGNNGTYSFNANGTVSMTTQVDGSYQFFLQSPPVTNVCTYALAVTPPAGSAYLAPSSQIPPQPGTFSTCGAVVASLTPPQGSDPTTYYLALRAGVNPANGTYCEALHNHIPLDPGNVLGLILKQEGSKSVAELGDFVDYAYTITNKTGFPVTGLHLTDVLPPGFAYIKGSARMNSVAVANPSDGAGPVGGFGPTLLFNFPTFPLGVDQSVILRYRLRIGVGAPTNGDATNHARASTASVQSNPASWRVRIANGVFADDAFAFGKVLLSCPGSAEADQIGVPGVRLFMEDGTNVSTDAEGKWSLYGLSAMTHVLRVDESTLPPGAQLAVLDNRNANNPASRFMDLKKGEFHKANFIIGNCDAPFVLADVAARRKRIVSSDADGAAVVRAPLNPQGKPLVLGDTRALPAAGQSMLTGALGSATLNSAALISLPASTTGGALSDAISAPFSSLAAFAGGPASAAPGSIGGMGAQGVNPLSGSLQPLAAPLLPAVTPAIIDLEDIMSTLDNTAAFIGLKDGDTVATQAINVRVKGGFGLQLLLSVNGVAIDGKRVGKKATLESSQLTAWEYIGVMLKPGPNTLELSLLDQFGNQRGSEHLSVIAPDQLSKIEITLPATARADGRTAALIEVRLTDAAGVLVTARTQLTLEADRGSWVDADLNPGEAGTQVFIEGGTAQFHLMAPGEPGDARVRVSAGVLVKEVRLAWLPELRPMIGVGVIEGVLDLTKRGKLALGQMPAGAAFETELTGLSSDGQGDSRAAGRSAFFFKGAIKGEYLLTAAFDSAKTSQQRLFRDIRPDDFYPVYGDSSVRGFDAQSTQKLYVRIDKNRSYLLYGDFSTTSSSEVRQLSQSNRTLTGVKNVVETDTVRATSYAARTSQTQQVEEFRAAGISGPYFLTGSGDLLVNSEKIELLIRDRDQPNIVLQSTLMTAFVDYTIESLTRRILFTHAIASLDSNLNPQSIRVTYESDEGGAQFTVAGTDVQVKVTDKVQLGVVASVDENPANARKLLAVTALARVEANTTMAGEVVRTDSDLLGQGQAARIELRHQGENLGLVAQTVKTDTGFDNPGSTFAAGHTEAVVRGEYKIFPKTQIRGEALYTKEAATDIVRKGIAASVQRKLTDTLVAEVGLRHGQNSSATASMFDYSQLASATGGSTGAVTSMNSLSAAAAGGDTNPSLNTVRGRLTTQVPFLPQAQVFVEGEQDVAHSDKHVLALGANYAVTDKTRLYGRYEMISTLDAPADLSSHNVGLFGVESTYMEGGRVYNEYRMAGAIDARTGQNATGIRNTFKLSEHVNATAGIEYTKANGTPAAGATTPTGDATAIVSGLEYLGERLKTSAVLETRQASDALTYLSNLGVGYKLSDAWSLLGRSTLTDSKGKGATEGNERRLSRQQIGLAYRPVDQDVWNALARYEHKSELIKGAAVLPGAASGSAFGNDPTALPGSTTADIVSAHVNFNPARGNVMTARYAAKISSTDDGTLKSTYWAHLLQARYTRDLSPDWDLGLQSGLMIGQGGALQKTLGLEVGYQVAKDIWLSAGYNVVGLSDRDLTAGEYTSRGLYLRVRMKFDERRLGFATPVSVAPAKVLPVLGALPAKTVWNAAELFEAEQSEILLSFRDTLDQIGPRLGIDEELVLRVQGANAALATSRADVLQRYLIGHGVDVSRLRLRLDSEPEPAGVEQRLIEISVVE